MDYETTGDQLPERLGTCEWFALCTNPAARLIDHPILGGVPTCERCAKLAGA